MNYAMITAERYGNAIAASMPVTITMKPKLSKETNAEYQKRARRGVLGLTLSWCDKNPFCETADITDDNVTHDNPTQRMIVKDMWRRCSKWITETEFTWLVKMVVIFDCPRGKKLDDYEFRFSCSLRGKKSDILNDAIEAKLTEARLSNLEYPEGHKNKGVYLQTEFVAKIVGV